MERGQPQQSGRIVAGAVDLALGRADQALDVGMDRDAALARQNRDAVGQQQVAGAADPEVRSVRVAVAFHVEDPDAALRADEPDPVGGHGAARHAGRAVVVLVERLRARDQAHSSALGRCAGSGPRADRDHADAAEHELVVDRAEQPADHDVAPRRAFVRNAPEL